MEQEKHFAAPDSSFLWQIAETCQTIRNSAQTLAWEEASNHWEAEYCSD